MARDWRKYNYNRQLFGQKVKEYRLYLGWSLGRLAKVSGINKGTLRQVEEGERSLPNDERCKLVDVLTEALDRTELHVNRREFLKLASVAAVSTALSTASSHTQPAGDPTERNIRKTYEDKSHEERAEILSQQQEWQQAATFWLLAAREAKSHGDWPKWARCVLSVGQMALNSGQFEVAHSRFTEVLSRIEDEVGTEAVAEAYIRLGWLFYEKDEFSQAANSLMRGLALLDGLRSRDLRLLRLPEHSFTLACEGNEVMLALERSGLHFLGRTYADWGIKENNHALMREGLAKLQRACDYDSKFGLDVNVGFALLRQIPIFAFVGDMRTTENLLAQSEALLGKRGTVVGHIYLHKGLLSVEEKPRRARDLFERALEGFVEPAFYSKGLSETLREISVVHLMDDRKTGDQIALQYALAATAMHPYGQNLEILRLAAHRTYWCMGESIMTFNKFWRGLEEKLWSMDSEPFSNLRYLMQSFGFENGTHHLEKAIEEANKAIRAERLL